MVATAVESSDLSALNRVNTHRRKLYLQSTTVVSELAGKDQQFKEAATRAITSARQAKSAKENLSKIRETESELSSKLETLRKRKLRNKLFPKKAAEKTSVLERNLVAVSEDAAVAKQHATRTREAAKADAVQCSELKAVADLLKKAEKDRMEVLEDVFGGEAGNKTENMIEMERDRLVEITSKTQDKLATQQNVYKLLQQAGLELVTAKRNLNDAQIANTVDIFSGGGIGFIAGIGSQVKINEAAKLVRAAGAKIQQALQINPKLPISKLAKVQDGVVLAFADIVLDGFITDLLVRMTIEKSLRSVETVIEAVKQSLDCQKSVILRLDDRFKNYSVDLQRTSEELVSVRANLFQNIIIN